MASILFVSKPLSAPWNDSGKNLARVVASGLRNHRPSLMLRAGDTCPVEGARGLSIYAARSGGFAPGMLDQVRVMSHLLAGPRCDLWHFFFAPNPRSCRAGRIATRLRGVRSVHTVSSAPRDFRAVVPHLFADVHVVLSEHSEARLIDAGLHPERVVRIPAAIVPLPPLDAPARREVRVGFGLPETAPVVVFPGDLEFGEGAGRMLRALEDPRLSEVHLVMACRAKTKAAENAERALRRSIAGTSRRKRVHFVGETPHIHALLGCADLVALPSSDLFAKMDQPLALLEAMSLGVAVLVSADSAAAELAAGGAAAVVESQPEALAHAVDALLSDASYRARIASAGQNAVRTRHDPGAVASSYARVYEQLLA